MNIYFLHNPLCIKEDAWHALLEVLDIDCVIDLLSYKETTINPPSCHNKVFSNIKERYCRKDMLPSNFSELSKEEKGKVVEKTNNRIFGRIIEKAKKYHGKKSYSDGLYIRYEKDRGNVLVLCFFDNQSGVIDYCARYFCGAIHNQNICDVGFVDLYKLHFTLRQSYSYNTHYKGRPRYANRFDFQNDDDYSDYERERQQYQDYYDAGDFWHAKFHYDTDKRIKICETMDGIFSKLESKYDITEKDLFKDELVEKIIANRKRYDESEIYRILKEEQERWDREMDDDWVQLGRDEVRSWDRDFPGWNDGD
ncbi:hypothetical protein AGMMS4957_22400 [Bacteroidia bacterium]|nr:hypothetical protein AGMMS4957_22400 [Bacteroidia bacterium]